MLTREKKKFINAFIFSTLLFSVVYLLWPASADLYGAILRRDFVAPYFPSLKEPILDTSSLPNAEAVPILMYHGIVREPDGINTSRRTFIKQMEMLYTNGYQTITLAEYIRFRRGEFTLPARPIIITFDDGRKDSFYPVDAILKKLGFTAVLFVATARANSNDPFYLSWEELAKVRDTGRFEIEAHGRHSHDDVIMGSDGKEGRYLAARIWRNGTLESITDFERRVVLDYQDCLRDLWERLGLRSRFFAAPLNNFGITPDSSNYDGAYELNKTIAAHFFDLVFHQVSQSQSGAPRESFYNTKDSDPYNQKRLDVGEMSASNLEAALRYYAPG
jgi:peptidoglycan/xylan/chitin deacetylase (PgdA/CDA1 family)